MINIPYIKFFLATLATLFLHLNSSVLHAQSYEFQAISTGEPILRTLWYAKDSKKIKIVATALMRSESYKYDLGPNVIFYGERVDEEGKPIAEAIAKLPADATRLLLFFNKLKKPDEFGLNYEVIVLEDDYSIGYQGLVKKKLGISLEKKETRSNWIKRPLSDAQLKYAALDV